MKPFSNLSNRQNLSIDLTDDPTEAGHDFLRQILEEDHPLREQIARLAMTSYRESGQGAVVVIWDDLFEGWPKRCDNPQCQAIHDAPAWPQQIPNLDNGAMFYSVKAAFDSTCDFKQQLLQKLERYTPSKQFVVAVLDRIQGKGAMGIFVIPRSLKSSRGFGQTQTAKKPKQR